MIGAGLRATVGRNGRLKARKEAASRAAKATPRSHATMRRREPCGVALRAGGAGSTVVRCPARVVRGSGSRSIRPPADALALTCEIGLGIDALGAEARRGTATRGGITTCGTSTGRLRGLIGRVVRGRARTRVLELGARIRGRWGGTTASVCFESIGAGSKAGGPGGG
jgi:hypothetical protein